MDLEAHLEEKGCFGAELSQLLAENLIGTQSLSAHELCSRASLSALEKREIRVGILPEGEEVVVGDARFGERIWVGARLQNVGPAQAKVSQRADRLINDRAPSGIRLPHDALALR